MSNKVYRPKKSGDAQKAEGIATFRESKITTRPPDTNPAGPEGLGSGQVSPEMGTGMNEDRSSGVERPSVANVGNVGGANPSGLTKKSDSGARRVQHGHESGFESGFESHPIVTSAQQVESSAGLPKFDKASWMREHMPAYMRRYRAEVKAGIRIPKPRETGE